MKRLLRHASEGQEGSIVLEACFSVILFILFTVMLYGLITVFMAQNLIGHRVGVRLPRRGDQLTAEAFLPNNTPIPVNDCRYETMGAHYYDDDPGLDRIDDSFSLYTHHTNYDGGDAKIRLKFNDNVNTNELTVNVYTGFYATEAAAQTAGAADITSQIWGDDAPGYLADYKHKLVLRTDR